MAVTLCVPPRAGELCAPVRFLVRQDSVVMELTARHRITSVEWDESERAVAMVVEITDPQTARPVDVRIDVVEAGAARRRHADQDDRHHRARRTAIRRRGHLPRRRRGRKLKCHKDKNGVRVTKRTAAIVGVHNTRQGRRLDGETSRGLALKAIHGALADAGLSLDDVDGISAGPQSTALIYDLRIGPAWQGLGFGVGMITEAATAIEHGMADVVVLVAAQAGEYRDHEATAPWTRPENEFVAPWGMFTTAEFALIARRHMHVYGTTREQLSIVAATIRNNGSQNPEAVYYQRGPFAPEDITASRPIADPFHLLDCATTSEGGCALVVANINTRWTSPASRSTCWAAARTSTARRISIRPRGTWSGGAATTSTVWSADGGRTRVQPRRTAARRRGRAGALRSVLLRDHSSARGVRILRRGRRRTIRRRRSHRHRRQPSGHHGRRNHVLQPRRRQSANDAARHPSGPAVAR